MEATEATIDFDFKARYYALGDLASAKEVWFVLHGYGQLAQYFIKKFSPLMRHGVYIIAPEGLSKFYLQGNQGRVGATWMTRENRLVDIQNYITYLDAVYTDTIRHTNQSTTILGFSQGAATAMRWAMNGEVEFDRMVLWAGLFPPDVDFQKGAELLKSKQVIEVLGKQDEFINAERIQEMHRLNSLLQISPTIIEFDGKHEMDENTLLKIASR